MKEKLYTIPVNDAFREDCECPICSMYKSLEKNAIEFTMGPSYMEDDIREETNALGFCNTHIKMMYENQNRLGLALMLSTHLEKTMNDVASLSKNSKITSGLFKKKVSGSSVTDYISKVNSTCFVCNKIENIFRCYLKTIFYLYKTEEEFRQLFKSSKGFCMSHYGLMVDLAPSELSGSHLENFLSDLNEIYLENMKRVHEDLTWFIDKFDYRYVNEPWKNSKDALPRSILKITSQDVE